MLLAGLVSICSQLMGQLVAGSSRGLAHMSGRWYCAGHLRSLPLGCSIRLARASLQEGWAQKLHSVAPTVTQGRPPRLQEVGKQADGEVATLHYKETEGVGGLFTTILAKSLPQSQRAGSPCRVSSWGVTFSKDNAGYFEKARMLGTRVKTGRLVR